MKEMSELRLMEVVPQLPTVYVSLVAMAEVWCKIWKDENTKYNLRRLTKSSVSHLFVNLGFGLKVLNKFKAFQ